jgi:hypothetical protein
MIRPLSLRKKIEEEIYKTLNSSLATGNVPNAMDEMSGSDGDE